MTSDNKDKVNNNEQQVEQKSQPEAKPEAVGEKKRLTLTLTKKSSDQAQPAQAGGGSSSAETPGTNNRSSVFVVPPQQRRPAFDGNRDRFRPLSDEERKQRMQMLRSSPRATSNVQIRPASGPYEGSRDSGFGPRRGAGPSKKRKGDYGSNQKTSRFQEDSSDSQKLRIGMGVVQTFSSDFDAEGESGWRKTRGKRESFTISKPSVIKTVEVYQNIEVQVLAAGMAVSTRDLARKLRHLGLSHAPTDQLDIDSAELLVIEFHHIPKRIKLADADDDPVADFDGNAVARPPIVTIVGHVDHGKTSLLDAIRSSGVAAGEAGGITQHIGAYQVKAGKDQLITFLDTPGHETFTSMRARGVQLTDIAILVISSDDGIQEQTVEAIRHVQDAGVQLIVAITKIDKPGANPDKILEMLLNYNIVTEKHSGDVLAVQVSAHKGTGLKELLEAILLQASMMDLTARIEGHAIGVVLETSVQKGFGNVANIVVQKGTLKVGDNFVLGKTYGRVRCLIDSSQAHLKLAGPSTPVAVVGIDGVCAPADRLVVVPSDTLARETAQARLAKEKRVEVKPKTLEELYADTDQGKVLNVLLKADTAGSVEALKQGISKIKNEEVSVKVIHDAPGPVTESDVLLADISKAMIVSFHNKTTPAVVAQLAAAKFIHIISDNIIYKILEELQKFVDGMKKPVINEVLLGKGEIIRVFEFSKGAVAGCKVLDGKIVRGAKVRVIRAGQIIAEGQIKSMQRETQDVKEAINGQECGFMMLDFHKYVIGDSILCYEEQTV